MTKEKSRISPTLFLFILLCYLDHYRFLLPTTICCLGSDPDLFTFASLQCFHLPGTIDNTRWAKVNGAGKVKALKAGKGKKVKITVLATDGSGKKKAVTIKIK